VGDLAAGHRPDLVRQQGDDRQRFAVEGHEFDLIPAGRVDVDDGSDVAAPEAVVGQIFGQDGPVEFP
jgi:hypothetical protein